MAAGATGHRSFLTSRTAHRLAERIPSSAEADGDSSGLYVASHVQDNYRRRGAGAGEIVRVDAVAVKVGPTVIGADARRQIR